MALAAPFRRSRDLEMIEMSASSIYISLFPSLSLDFRPRRISIWPDRTDILRSIFIFHPIGIEDFYFLDIFGEIKVCNHLQEPI